MLEFVRFAPKADKYNIGTRPQNVRVSSEPPNMTVAVAVDDSLR